MNWQVKCALCAVVLVAAQPVAAWLGLDAGSRAGLGWAGLLGSSAAMSTVYIYNDS